MTRQTSDSSRYMLQVGNNRFRRDTWESVKDICAIEGTPMADEIWQALDMHVRAYAERQDNDIAIKTNKSLKALESKSEDELEPAPDFSMPENDNLFDKIIDDMVAEAAEEEVEEVVSEERTKHGRVVSSDMFGHYRKQ